MIVAEIQATSVSDFCKKFVHTEHKFWYLENMNRIRFNVYLLKFIEVQQDSMFTLGRNYE